MRNLALIFALIAALSVDAAFRTAEPVWPAGLARERNCNIRFSASFDLSGAGNALLRITGSSVYRIRLNGRFVGYGPARGPVGWFRVDEWPLAAAVKSGANELEIDVVGYNVDTYYIPNQPAFLQAEVVAGDRVVAATSACGAFTARRTERVRTAPRYSVQRAYGEAYWYDENERHPPLTLAACPPVRLLPRIAPYPDFALNRTCRALSGSMDLVGRWGRSVVIDAGLNDCGFTGMKVEVLIPGTLTLRFDEVLADGKVNDRRMNCRNVVEWTFNSRGTYEIETIEPYVWRYAELSTLNGEFGISDFHVRTYKNPETGRASFRSSDPALEKVFAAAKETFAQNAVDVFTDCPSRERAGWLCDSFFIGRMNALFCGNAELERLFLQNYALPEGFAHLPDGMVPMCYPGDHPSGNFIPNWAMWLVIETEEYLRRSGDRETVDALKPRFLALVKYLKTFVNADGLLENLPKWVFVEWSQCNKLVQDVNYPSNMTWAEVLDVMDRLYGMPELAAEAERVRETVRRQSWNGKWFCDNAVRQADGTLKPSGECTETCQYYAFFFRTATPESHPGLWKTLVEDFGPGRKRSKKHPEIWPSNAFIGNYLRLECLSREGYGAQILDETKGFFLYMAERTGTLWEHDGPKASCNHGFASHAAMYLYRDVLGVRSIDRANRTVRIAPSADIPLDWCEGTLPVSPTEMISVKWRKVDGKPAVEAVLPPGWSRNLLGENDFAGWHTYLKGFGRDNDPQGVFSVSNGILRITGETWGALVTEEEFSDYRLDVEYRWTGKKWPSKEKAALDSGILFHSTGPDGGFAGIWQFSHEFNIILGASGDIWTVGSKKNRPDMFVESTAVKVSNGRGEYLRYDPQGEKVILTGNRRLARTDIDPTWTDSPAAKAAANEKPVGEWNTATLVCRGESVECLFNGKLVNRATKVVPSRGKIQLQSEGCEIEFRRVRLTALEGSEGK